MNTLKDIFQPTRKKLVYAVLVGPAVTFAALVLTGLARHGPDVVQYLTLPFMIPYALVGWLNVRDSLVLIALPVFTFLYWYIIFSICMHLFPRTFGTR